MDVAPEMKELPFIVALVMIELPIVLFDKVSTAFWVTTTPLDGNTAVEATPVPPKIVGKAPVTAFT
jgi:hypothetical protein